MPLDNRDAAPSGDGSLYLVPVVDPATDLALRALFPRGLAEPHGALIPVPADSLNERLDALRSTGAAVHSAEAGHAVQLRKELRAGGTRFSKWLLPSLIVPILGANAEGAAFASWLCNAPLATLDELLGRDATSLGEDPSVLVLVGPLPDSRGDEFARLGRLADAGIGIGLMFAHTEAHARQALVQTMCSSLSCTAANAVRLMSEGYGAMMRARGVAAPLYQPTRPSPTSENCAERVGVLVLNGHGNPFDFRVTNDFILCSRPAAAVDRAGVYPCFHNGVCFRQRQIGEPDTRTDNLIRINELNAGVVVLSGCDVLPIGSPAVGPELGLAHAALMGSAQACIAAAGTTAPVIHLEALLLALLLEGTSLGKAVAMANDARRRLGYAYGGPDGFGPFMLIGNPALRLHGARPHVTELDLRGRGQFSRTQIDFPAADAAVGRFLKVRVARRDQVPFVRVGASPNCCYGVYVQQQPSEADIIYAWVLPSDPAEERGGSLALFLDEDAQVGVSRRVLGDFVGSAAFWTALVDGSAALASRSPRLAAKAETTAATFPGLRSTAATLLARAIPRRGLIVDDSTAQELEVNAQALVTLIVEQWVGLAAEIISATGFLWLAWMGEFSQGPVVRRPIVCAGCGSDNVEAQRFISVTDKAVTRHIFECAGCGYIGECGEADPFVQIDFPKTVRRGAALEVAYRLDPNANATAEHLIFEDWYDRGACETGRCSAQDGGETRRMSLDIAEQTVPGLYPLSLMVVVDGVANVRRHLIQVV